MSHCPSHDWDRHLEAQEMPTECPVCGKDNADEDGNPICIEAPTFCSKECETKYAREYAESETNHANEQMD